MGDGDGVGWGWLDMVSTALHWRHNKHLKSLASRLFAQPFVHVQIKENIKAQHQKMFPFDDFIMIVVYRHYMESWTLVNIGLGNGSVPDGTELLPEPVLMYHQ